MALVKLVQSNRNTIDWTQQAQSYFAAYGTPPAPTASAASSSSAPATSTTGYQAPDGNTLATAVAALYDTTGQVAFADQASAYQTLMDYRKSSQDFGPVRIAIEPLFVSSPFLGAGTKEGFASLDAWKVQLGKDQATINAENTPDQSSTSSSTSGTTVGASAVASVASSNASAKKALAALTAAQPTGTDAQVALTLLQNAAKTTAMTQAANYKSTSGTMVSSAGSSISETPSATNSQMAYRVSHTVSITT